MIYLLSPAKTLDYDSVMPSARVTMPRFLEHSSELAGIMKKMTPAELEELMGISSKLADLNAERFRTWKPDYTKDDARSAIFAFKGGVYQGLAVDEWGKEDFAEAQKSIRILSGLYGVLRPLDLMLPYRLEMGKKVANQRGPNLYHFWGSLLTESLNKELRGANDAVINLASNEYFAAIKPRDLTVPVITPVFKDWKNGKYKVISFYAKKARGMMAAWAVKNKVTTPAGLKQFKGGGYQIDPDTSDANTLVFTRNEA
ncbi:MAG: peroxide stress protein YaaA [Verrucomicrobiae bacterium]|nr:peroxide stress protein YaaA [Verrucomicrobiae bacterium]NNJ42051.1 peroxide stress protein YaaA [Akkermansiaceae bacterium]